MTLRNKYFYAAVLFAVLIFSASSIFAQEKSNYKDSFCSNNWSSGDKVNAADEREFTLPVRNTLEVDGKQNGGISVRGENRNDILVRACVVAWSSSKAEAQNAVSRISINTNSVIAAENTDGNSWSVSYQILVPRNMNLKLTANNGGISINSVAGMIEFFTKNGGISLQDLAGDVIGKTQNGGVSVKLSGNTWIGNGLNVETKNGGVKLVMPENYAANIETGTVNGGFKSDIAVLQTEGTNKWRNNRINTSINGGGAPIRVVTTNGGIKIGSFETESRTK